MVDKAKLGTRYVCFECGTKFYDLNRPKPLCPECKTDQSDAPVRDIRSLLSGSGRKFTQPEEEVVEKVPKVSDYDEDEDDDGDGDGEDEEEDGGLVEFGAEDAADTTPAADAE